MTKNKDFQKGEIIIYKSRRGPDIQVKLQENNVWLDAHLLAKLFDVDRTVIVKHINNIYKTNELSKKSTCAKIAQLAADGKVRKMNLYNLDMIISVGYRVNSKQATQFRIWATKTLREHLVKGYTLNEKRLLQYQNSFQDLQETIVMLQEKSKHKLFTGQEQEILNLLSSYSKTLTLLRQYDNEKLILTKKIKGKYILQYDEVKMLIEEIKKDLIAKNEASDLFGQENRDDFKAIINNVYQTFDNKELYSSLEEKAAHILYLVIKDHPFVDGNKRIGSFLFIYYLDKNNYLYKTNGEKKINDNALTTLALLIAVSKPREKDKLIKIVTNLLSL